MGGGAVRHCKPLEDEYWVIVVFEETQQTYFVLGFWLRRKGPVIIDEQHCIVEKLGFKPCLCHLLTDCVDPKLYHHSASVFLICKMAHIPALHRVQ